MSFENRQAVIDWLNGHKGENICLQAHGSMLKVVGRSEGVDRLDACSTLVFECELITCLQGIQIAMSFHAESLALHLLGSESDNGPVFCSIPLSIPYDQVRLSVA